MFDVMLTLRRFMNDRGIKDEMFFRIFQVYFYLIPPQVNGNKQINER